MPTAPLFTEQMMHARKLRDRPLSKQGGAGFFLKKTFPALDEAKKKKTGPNPAIKNVRLNCLKVTIAEFVKKKN